jgi:uncharacterized protein YjiS (DUF1127 family)
MDASMMQRFAFPGSHMAMARRAPVGRTLQSVKASLLWRLRHAWLRGHAIGELDRLTDLSLRDIGLARADIEPAVDRALGSLRNI